MRVFQLPTKKAKIALKKSGSFALALGLFSALALSAVPTAYATTTAPGARVSFTFDDGLASALTEAAPTLAKHGFIGTNYISTGCIGTTGTCPAEPSAAYMTWDQVTQLKNTYGWEIASHTVNHPLLASTDPESQPDALTLDQVIQELTQSKANLAAHGITANDFATPYGDWTPAVMALIAKTYASHRGFADSIDQDANGVVEHGNGFPYNDYLLYDLPVQAGVTVDQVKSYIDQTKTNNQWLILTFHNINPNASTDPDNYEYSTADLDQIAAYVKSLGIPVVNIADGLAGGTNLLPNSTFDSGIAGGWTTDAPANITADSGSHGSYPSPGSSLRLTSSGQVGHLFSPQVSVDAINRYFIKSFLNVTAITVAAGNEVGFIVDEFDASGNYLSFQYRRAETGVFIENLNFEYIPTNANVKSARLQVVVTANSGIDAYLDNVQWFVQGGGLGGGSLKAGDVNGDNAVNALDLSIIASNWMKNGATKAQGDLNSDAIVNALDLSILATNWGK